MDLRRHSLGYNHPRTGCRVDSKEPVTILMPAYNADRTIAESIYSVLAQTYPHWELIVLDDGSTDRTAEICSTIADKNPRIKLVHLDHGGVCKSSNYGLRVSSTNLVARLDSDDIWHPTKLEKQVNFL